MIVAKQILWNPLAKLVTTTPYNILATDKILNIDTTVPRTLNLPTPANGWAGNLKDVSGSAFTNNITLSRNGGGYKINGVAADLVLTSPGGGWFVYTDGTDVFVVGPS